MNTAVDAILAFIGAVVAGGGTIALITYGIFRFLGEKWLNAKFSERLEAYKHAQQRELEQLKFRINALMDRTVKLHQREFDVLPEAWGRLTDAYGITAGVLAAFQQYPDLDRMNIDHLNEFLGTTPLMEWQKAELRTESRKTAYYIRAISWHRIAEARNACREFHVHLLKNGIFIPIALKTKFKKIDQLLYEAIVEAEINAREEVIPKLSDATKKLNTEGAQTLDAIEDDVQARLWSEEATPS